MMTMTMMMSMIIVMIMMTIMRTHRRAVGLLGVPKPQSDRVALAGDRPRGRADGGGEQSGGREQANADIASYDLITIDSLSRDYPVTIEWIQSD